VTASGRAVDEQFTVHDEYIIGALPTYDCIVDFDSISAMKCIACDVYRSCDQHWWRGYTCIHVLYCKIDTMLCDTTGDVLSHFRYVGWAGKVTTSAQKPAQRVSGLYQWSFYRKSDLRCMSDVLVRLQGH